jgi:putative phosphoesterase
VADTFIANVPPSDYLAAARVPYSVVSCIAEWNPSTIRQRSHRNAADVASAEHPRQRARHDGRVKLLLIADTHVPHRARDLPNQVWRAVDEADVVVHAGDWVCVELLDALLARSNRLIGVVGNNDGPALCARLPEVATAELAGIRLAVVHETGSVRGREQRCAARFPDSDVLVFGHSHIPWDTVAPTGLRLLNPGSPTDRRRQPTCSWMTAEIIGGQLGRVQLHRPPAVTR